MNASPERWQAILPTPIGGLGIAVAGGRLIGIDFLGPDAASQAACDPLAAGVERQLRAYFADPAAPFELPLEAAGTAFQHRVWRALQAIPPGQTRTYGEIAAELGSSARAVGGACRANPIPVVVPCHRVVAAQGPGGFAGSRTGFNLQIKEWLLRHEAGAGRACA